MKIFLSWSGKRSRAIAEALNDWLPRVIQAVEPFFSPDIEKGANWNDRLRAELDGTFFGIICLTPDNLNSTWIHYEAGALLKTKDALISTLLHGIKHGDVVPPLSDFQWTIAEKEDDVLKLLKTINNRVGESKERALSEKHLESIFAMFWPELEKKLKAAESLGDATQVERSAEDMLLEVLESVRYQQRAFPFLFDYIENVAKMASINKLSPYPLAPSFHFFNPYRDREPLYGVPTDEPDETSTPIES